VPRMIHTKGHASYLPRRIVLGQVGPAEQPASVVDARGQIDLGLVCVEEVPLDQVKVV
jgi:hypothetical protein